MESEASGTSFTNASDTIPEVSSSFKTIEFWFEESDYYKFLLDENNLFNGIKISVNMTGSTDDYESRFNTWLLCMMSMLKNSIVFLYPQQYH